LNSEIIKDAEATQRDNESREKFSMIQACNEESFESKDLEIEDIYESQ